MKSVSPWWVYTLMSLLSFFSSSFIFKAWLPGDLFCVCIAVGSARDRACAQFSQARKTSPLYGESCVWPGKSIRVQGIFKSALAFTSTGTHVFSMQVFRLCGECVRGLCFSQVQSLPQVRVPGTRQARHFGGPPTRKSPPLLVSSIKPGKSHSTFLPPWQPGAVKQHDYS